MSYLPPVLQILLLGIAIPAGVSDLRVRRIPNWLVLAGMALGLGLNTLLYGWTGIAAAAKGAGLALAVYFPLFALRAMGAGDAKLMAAVGSIVGPGNWLIVFFLTAALGGILALATLAVRKRMAESLANVAYIVKELVFLRAPYDRREELSAGHPRAISMPHGAVITAASILFLAALNLLARR